MKSTPMSSLALRLAGWQFEGEPPREKKYVALAVPHTSNWDGLLLVLLARAVRLPMAWMIKGEWLKGPLGSALRRTGAIAIDRSKASNMVDQMVGELGARDELALMIPPEGTRKRTEHWKSGFYHIARGADVPVVFGYLDYARKRAGLGEPIRMTGDVKEDMDQIRAFYAVHKPIGRNPAAFGPIQLREEG